MNRIDRTARRRGAAAVVVGLLVVGVAVAGGPGIADSGPPRAETTAGEAGRPGAGAVAGPAQALQLDGTTGTEIAGTMTAVSARTQSRRRAVIRAIPDSQWHRMRRAGVVRAGCPVRRQQLRRVEVWHVGFDGRVRRGVLVVNADVARDVAEIFDELLQARFPIRSVRPIEAFAGDDNASMAADNTSAYNCRRPGQANAPSAKSPHANGRAVDINPRENPWWDQRCACFQPAARHAPRTAGKGKILRGGVVWRAFTSRGWIWQNIATPDYQHFDTGYPSRPR